MVLETRMCIGHIWVVGIEDTHVLTVVSQVWTMRSWCPWRRSTLATWVLGTRREPSPCWTPAATRAVRWVPRSSHDGQVSLDHVTC